MNIGLLEILLVLVMLFFAWPLIIPIVILGFIIGTVSWSMDKNNKGNK